MHKQLIYEILEEICPFEEIEDTTEIITLGLLDSLDIANLIDSLEEELGIEIRSEDVIPENFASVNAINDLCTKYTESK